MKLMLCTLMLVSVAAGYDQDYCYAHEDDPYLFFSTKTAYEFVHEKTRNPENIPNCKPFQFWLLSRHGTRYPDKENISTLGQLSHLKEQILRNRETRHQGRLCQEDLDNLREWRLAAFPSQASRLTNQGYDEMKYMAMRFKSQFPTLLNRSYSESLFQFRYTDSERAKESARAFSEGLFRSSTGIHFPEPTSHDELLRGYKTCARWIREVDNNTATYNERNLFQMGTLMQNLAQNVSSRLGFGYTLPFTEIDKMYDMCRYDKAWNIRKTSAWCAAFSKEELQLLEYREDLKYYYESGYGNELNVRLGCPPVKDFIDRFSQIEEGNQQPQGVFYFTHSTMLDMLLARLGIAKDDEPLTHSNYNSMKNRKWKTSKLSGFASNLAAVFFKCNSGERYKVMFYLGERLVSYKGCNVGLCDWSFIKDKFSTIASECNLDFCRGDGSGTKQIFAVSWLVTASAVIAVFCRQNLM